MTMRNASRAPIAASAAAPSRLGPDEALTAIALVELPEVFHRWGPFPGVAAVEEQHGPWTTPGRSRRLRFTDGGTATETMTAFTPGVRFAYDLRGFTDVFGRLVAGVRGEWTATADPNGSVVRWTWTFEPRRGARLLMAGVVVPLYRRYMRRVVDAHVALIESRTVHSAA